MDFVDSLQYGGIHRTLNAPQLRGKLENHLRATGLRKKPVHNRQRNWSRGTLKTLYESAVVIFLNR